jgi:hypothetical protein
MKPLLLTVIIMTTHLVEDAVLISIGRFVPLSVWAVYPIGLLISATVLTAIISKLTRGHHENV